MAWPTLTNLFRMRAGHEVINSLSQPESKDEENELV
jgi:hypothetical protein